VILPFLAPKRGNSFCEALYLPALLANRELLQQRRRRYSTGSVSDLTLAERIFSATPGRSRSPYCINAACFDSA